MIGSKEIRVAIFEDNPIMMDAYRSILNGSPGYMCPGSFTSCNNWKNDIKKSNPDVILMDIEMTGINGIAATKLIKKEFPAVKILMQTVFEDDAKVFAAICAGANGYILKSTPPVKLLEAIKEVSEGGSPMTPSVAAKVLKMFKDQNRQSNALNDTDLSGREKEILTLLVDGLSYKFIADKLFISYETVHSHVKKIYQKLHVNSVNEAISKALRNKIV